MFFPSKKAALQRCSVEGGFEEHDMVSSEALAKWSARPSARNGHGSVEPPPFGLLFNFGW